MRQDAFSGPRLSQFVFGPGVAASAVEEDAISLALPVRWSSGRISRLFPWERNVGLGDLVTSRR